MHYNNIISLISGLCCLGHGVSNIKKLDSKASPEGFVFLAAQVVCDPEDDLPDGKHESNNDN